VTSFYARIFIKNAEKHANFQRKHWALRADFAKKNGEKHADFKHNIRVVRGKKA
jgi:hypothetical protein